MNTRRPAHAAGHSWRKWEDPLMYGPVGPDWTRRGRVVLFLLVCIDLGALAGLVVAR